MGRLQKKITFKGGVLQVHIFFLVLKQFWTIKYSKTVKYFDDLKQFTAFKVANMHYYLNPHLTLIERGSWILLESGGGLNQPTPSRSPQNTVKNPPKIFEFLKVHNELGKVTKFWTSRPLSSWRNSHLLDHYFFKTSKCLWKFLKFPS